MLHLKKENIVMISGISQSLKLIRTNVMDTGISQSLTNFKTQNKERDFEILLYLKIILELNQLFWDITVLEYIRTV